MLLRMLHFGEQRLPFLMKSFWRRFYNFLANRFQTPEWRFMNYSYANPEETYLLPPEDEANRYFIQLYAHLLTSLDLTAKHVLEVGCGRGGGADWIVRTQPVASLTGVDLSDKAIALCRKLSPHPNLTFQQGDAERLPFPDNHFDVLLNVESCQHYPHLPTFLAEVARVLKPGGYFCVTVYFSPPEEQQFRADLAAMPLTMLNYWEITPHVLRGLDLTEDYKRDMLQRHAPRYLWPLLKTFSSSQNSELYQDFANGKMLYVSAILQKPVA